MRHSKMQRRYYITLFTQANTKSFVICIILITIYRGFLLVKNWLPPWYIEMLTSWRPSLPLLWDPNIWSCFRRSFTVQWNSTVQTTQRIEQKWSHQGFIGIGIWRKRLLKSYVQKEGLVSHLVTQVSPYWLTGHKASLLPGWLGVKLKVTYFHLASQGFHCLLICN